MSFQQDFILISWDWTNLLARIPIGNVTLSSSLLFKYPMPVPKGFVSISAWPCVLIILNDFDIYRVFWAFSFSWKEKSFIRSMFSDSFSILSFKFLEKHRKQIDYFKAFPHHSYQFKILLFSLNSWLLRFHFTDIMVRLLGGERNKNWKKSNLFLVFGQRVFNFHFYKF